MNIIHSFPVWLPITQTWMYNQIFYLPPEVQTHVVCERIENLKQFSLPRLHCLFEINRLQYYWEKTLRRLEYRHYIELLVKVAKRNNVSILHSHFGNIGWGNLKAAKKARLRHVVSFYGQDVNRFPQQDERWYERYHMLFEIADMFLCEGPHMASCLLELGCTSTKVRVHHLGVTVREIEYKPRAWRPGQPLRVLIAATFTEKKGIPDALEALGRIQHEVPLEISIIGDARNDPESFLERERILRVIENHSLESKTRMLGFLTHGEFFAEAYRHHIFLSPSVTAADGDTEGGAPVSLIEMAATGMPIVSTLHCDIPAIIKNGETGLLAEERDVDGLTRHLEWLVMHPDLWQPMLDAGRNLVEREYDANVQGQRLFQAYQSLLVDTHAS